MNPVWKLNFFLFNIEGYGEFFSGITPSASLTSQDNDILQKSKSIDGCLNDLSIFSGIFFYVNNTSFFFHWHLFLYFISNNNCRLLTINIVSFIFFYYRESKPPFCLHYEKSSTVNIVSRKINWQKPWLHKCLYPIRV